MGTDSVNESLSLNLTAPEPEPNLIDAAMNVPEGPFTPKFPISRMPIAPGCEAIEIPPWETSVPPLATVSPPPPASPMISMPELLQREPGPVTCAEFPKAS